MNADFLKQLLVAFNEHDIDGIMDFFTDDCTLDMPRGTDPWGTRYVNRDQVRLAFTNRFNSIPDVHYSDDRHWVAGNRGVSEWTLTGTTTAGVYVQVRGCDLWDFRDGKILRKDSYWKIVER